MIGHRVGNLKPKSFGFFSIPWLMCFSIRFGKFIFGAQSLPKRSLIRFSWSSLRSELGYDRCQQGYEFIYLLNFLVRRIWKKSGILVVVRDIHKNFRQSCIFRECKLRRKKSFFLLENHDCKVMDWPFLSNRKVLQKIKVKNSVILGWKKIFIAIYE